MVGYAGRLVPEKGVALLLRACAGLGGPWQLRYLGAGPERERLGRLAGELGVADRVRFDAPLPATEVPRWLAEIDVLVLPSRTRPHWREQFGRVLVEAMLSGVPVVGSSSGEIPHLIGDAGLVFPEEDAAALRACLERLGADPALRSRLAAAGRARALAHYTHERIAAATYRVYREVLDEPWPDPRPRWTPPDEWQHPSPDEAMTRRGGPTVVGDAPSQAAAPAGAEPSDRTEGTR